MELLITLLTKLLSDNVLLLVNDNTVLTVTAVITCKYSTSDANA